MKLPKFKLPKIKLPKFGKGDDDEDDFEDFDEDFGEEFDPEVFSGETGDGAAALAAEEAKAARAAEAEAAEGGEGDAAVPDDMPPSPASETIEPEDGPPPSPASESILPEADMEDAEGMPTPSSMHHDDEPMPDFGDDEDDDEDGGEGGKLSNLLADPKKRKIIIIAAAGLVLLLGLGGGAWWFFSGDGEGDVNIASQEEGGGLTPPGGEEGHGADAPSEPEVDPNSLNAIGERDAAAGPGEGIVVPPMTSEAFSTLAPIEGVVALTPAPDVAVAERSAYGLLPKISEDGREPWQVYARPFDAKAADLPKVSVLITGLGMSMAATEAAITKLPPEVSLAFDPYVDGLAAMAEKARQHGHETLISLPLESGVFPLFDPGTKALTTANKPEENAVLLHDVMASMTGYVGVLTTFGSKFDQSEHHVKALMDEFKARGVLVVDGGEGPKSDIPKVATQVGVPRVMVDMPRLTNPSPEGIAAYFAQAEAMARKRSVVVLAVEPYPAVLKALAPWLEGLKKKNIVVAPVSAVANKQFLE